MLTTEGLTISDNNPLTRLNVASAWHHMGYSVNRSDHHGFDCQTSRKPEQQSISHPVILGPSGFTSNMEIQSEKMETVDEINAEIHKLEVSHG